MKHTAIFLQNDSDSIAFRNLFGLFYAPIFGYIFRRTGNFDDAADIASETFFKAFKAFPRFTDRGIPVKIWLYRIATNEVNLHFRYQKKYTRLFDRNGITDPELFNDYLQEDRQTLEKELLQHGQFLEILAELKTLPLKYQDVIALRYFEGKDNAEIAVILNLKEGTVKSQISRGLQKLRNKCKPV